MTAAFEKNLQQGSQPYEFTSDWFSMNIPVWAQLISQVNPAKALEIGCYEGRSTTWLIENCKPAAGLEVHCIDPWAEYSDLPGQKMSDIEVRFDKNVALAKKGNPAATVHKHKKFSSTALAELIATKKPGYFDLAYIDGSHQAADVLSDAVMSFHLLHVKGIMIFDDYLWQMNGTEGQNPLRSPKVGIDAFLNVFQGKMRIVSGTPLYQIYAEKISE